MKIYIFGSSRIGGVRISTMSLANSLEFLGYEIEYIIGIKSISFLIKSLLNIYQTKEKKYFFITWGIYNLIPLPRKRILCFMHGFPSYNQQDIIRYYLFRLIILINKVRRIRTISVSKFSHIILKDIFKINTHVIRNSVPYNYLAIPCNKEINKDIDIIFIGRANSFKLPNYIISYLEELAQDGLKVIVIGSGKSKDNYLKFNKNTKINFYDYVEHEDVIKFLKRSKYFISCSDSEPFGLVFIEALLCGCKTISPRSGGLLEISSLFPGSLSFLFNFYDDKFDAKDLIHGLDFSNKKVSDSLLSKINKVINTQFNPISHAEKVIEHLNLLGN